MRAEGTPGSPSVGRLLMGLVLTACGALSITLAVANRDVAPSADRQAGDSAEVLGKVLERTGRPDDLLPPEGFEAPAAIAGVVDLPDGPAAPSAVDGPAPASAVTLRPTAPPDRASTAHTTTTTVGPPPEVANQPIDLRVEITVATSGGHVTISVTATDPDAALQPPLVCVTTGESGAQVGFRGNEPPTDTCVEPSDCGERGSGGDAALAVHSEGGWTMQLEAREPGTYTVEVSIASGPEGCEPHPFASFASSTRTITVVP